MTYQSTIVVVDDNSRVLENFQDEAQNKNVIIKVFESWDLAKEHLEANQSIDGIVLDAKGKLTMDKQESSAHLHQALTWISHQEGAGRIIPYAVHTAFYDDMEVFSEIQEAGRMFRKGTNSESQVLDYLKERIFETPRMKLIAKYPSTFVGITKGYINRKYEDRILEVLTCLEEEDYRKRNINVVRDVLESIFLTLIENYDCIPESFINDRGNPNLEWCTRYLEGRNSNGFRISEKGLHKGVPAYISSSIRYLKERTSEYSHIAEDDICKTQLISTSYSMLEVLEWLPIFIEENFEY